MIPTGMAWRIYGGTADMNIEPALLKYEGKDQGP
jgi:hypothetical protein